MKNFYRSIKLFLSVNLFLGVLSMNTPLFAQWPDSSEPCGTMYIHEQMTKTDPQYQRNLDLLEEHTADFIRSDEDATQKNSGAVVLTIPVVFHIIHYGGPENISDAQVYSAMQILNDDFRRTNADTSATPAPFKPIAADTEIEFKLATKDPSGNCTDGIIRVYSDLTFVGNNTVKALSYWPSNQYLNIWVVDAAYPTLGQPPRTGYAQFPGGNPLTDGVVLGHQYVGDVDASANAENGRWITHEVGHWLNLRHIWGDANCGNDFVADTPPADGDHSAFNCPSHPFHVNACGAGSSPDGEMFMNYMDYMTGQCMNLFTQGQSARMQAALNSSVSGRNNLWTTSNLIATGTDPGSTPALCAPVASFNENPKIICAGTSIQFFDYSYNGQPDTWSWTFPGGTPAASTDSLPSIVYNTPGVYDVSLTVSNAAGNDSYTVNGIITVVPATGQTGIPFYESFENISFPNNDWSIEPGPGNTWEQTTLAAKTGANAVYINNHSGNPTGSVNSFLTPTYNFQWSTAHSMTFELAYAIRSTNSSDQLKVFASTTCGQLWNVRYTKSGSNLATAGLVGSPFFPVAVSQWATQSVSIASSSYNNKPNVRFKFEYVHDTGNNIFIDDINIDGTVGIDDEFSESIAFSVFPNPVIASATVAFELTDKARVYIDVLDVMGRVVNRITESSLNAGEYQFELPVDLSNGLYNVRIFVDGRSTSKKILINR